MHENLKDFLLQVLSIILYGFASMLFIFIINTHFQMNEAFLKAYMQQRTVSEGIPISLAKGDFTKGTDIIFSIYDGLENPITIDGVEVPADVDVSKFNFSMIDCNRSYKRTSYINDAGKIVKVAYH